jgi:hypothetical protein
MHWREQLRADVRIAYLAGRETTAAISDRFNISETTLNRWRREGNWPSRGQKGRWRPHGAPADPAARQAALIERLYRVAEHTLARLEEMMGNENASVADQERVMRLIGACMRSMERVKQVGRDHSGSQSRSGSGEASFGEEEARRFRSELAEQIARLQEQYRAGDGAGANTAVEASARPL